VDTGAEGDAGFDYPAYGAGALCDVLPAIGTALGVQGLDEAGPESGSDGGTGRAEAHGNRQQSSGAVHWWNLSPVRRACLFLVDGMGSELILKNADAAPYLAALLRGGAQRIGPGGSGHVLTAGFPSTTSTSLSSIGTGMPPGVHGMLGYKLAVPGTGKLMNFLRWDQDVDPLVWQPRETMFERLQRAGVAVTHVSSPRFADSGLTRSVFRGARFCGAEPADERAMRALEVLEQRDRSLVYLYYSDLDFVGHVSGVGSQRWLDQIGYVDALVQWLAERLPSDCSLYVVADHGMIDVPTERRIDADTDWELRAGVALLGGEARARHVYAHPGAERDVLAIWSERLDGVAQVRSREEAIVEGWFGPSVDARMSERIGHVVVAMRDDWAVIASEREAIESRLIGMHGSMTAAEQYVPLLEVRG
jgi:predicted AlkP superfamily pyrophosphatase or phosphodiesterase